MYLRYLLLTYLSPCQVLIYPTVSCWTLEKEVILPHKISLILMHENRKILLIGKVAHPKTQIIKGGISRHIKDLAEELAKNKIPVTIWDFRLFKTYYQENISIAGPSFLSKINSIIYCILCLGLFTKRKYRYLSFKNKIIVSLQLNGLILLIKKERFSTVHVHSLLRPISPLLRNHFPNLNIIVTDHGFWQKPERNMKENLALISKNIQAANNIIYISDFAFKKFMQYDLPLKKLVKIPNPINLETLPLLNVSKKKQLVFNGVTETLTRKNLPLLIQALQNDPFFVPYTLVAIVNKRGRKFLEDLNLPFKVTILGVQRWKNIVRIYNESELLVVPSQSESFGLVYLESLAIGTPIIGFDKTVREFQKVLKINIGYPFDAQNESSEDLAIKIKSCLNTTYNREEIRAVLANHYAWPNNLHSFLGLYQ